MKIYSSLLLGLSFFTTKSLGVHAALVNLVALATYVSRDILPVAIGGMPADQKIGAPIWILMGLLAYTGFIGPVITPRKSKSGPLEEVS